MFKLFKKKSIQLSDAEFLENNLTIKEIIEKIHLEFNTAGENALAEAQSIINGTDDLIEKADLLEKHGFKNSICVNKAKPVRMNKVIADLIVYYKQKYPFNKFISEEQVKHINEKYKLICAPVSNYTGFVPKEKLNQIHNFNLDKKDVGVNMVRITRAWGGNLNISSLEEKKGGDTLHDNIGMDFIPINHKELHWHGSTLFSAFGYYVEKYDLIDRTGLFICAPKKDININGLTKVDNILQSIKSITVPDPVVLQSVIVGYLIIAAWGDEASDEIVVNEKLN